MRRTKVRRLAAWLVIALVATTVAVTGVPTGAGAAVRRPLHEARPVGSAPVEPSFPVDFFGLVADVDGELTEVGRAPFGEVRFRHHGRWGPWTALAADGAQAPGTFTAGLVAADRADAYQVRALPRELDDARAAAINVTSGPVVERERTHGATAAAATGCRSRADWNADESITAWSRGTDTQAFAPVQVTTVHHTATSNDPSQSYADTVRAIEVYHVQTNGWSDIGYQYLIDPSGVLYEGRHSGETSRSCLTDGGDGSDFAHRATDDALVTGAHVGGYNTGNVGIALLGCFDESAACSGDTTPRQPAVDATTGLLTDLSRRHGLDPDATTTYSNGTNTKTGVPTISGHRDWEATACPGSRLYALLPQIRESVAASLSPGDPNQAPTVTMSGSCSGARCSFSGSASDPEGGATTLAWRLPGGSPSSAGDTSAVTTTYGSTGTYTVTLEATDPDGLVGSASSTVKCTWSGKGKRRTLQCRVL